MPTGCVMLRHRTHLEIFFEPVIFYFLKPIKGKGNKGNGIGQHTQ